MPAQTPSNRGFRRRLPLELSHAELALLERQQARFASKRATLVAGLEALAARAEEEAALAALAAELEGALERVGELGRRVAQLEKALAKSKSEVKKASQGREAQERSGARARAAAEQEAAELRAELAQAQAIRGELEQELEELEERAVDALLCQRCNQWLGPGEWASQQADDGREYLYCRSCGYQAGSAISNASILGYRDA